MNTPAIPRIGHLLCNCGRLKPADLPTCEDCAHRENKAVIQVPGSATEVLENQEAA